MQVKMSLYVIFLLSLVSVHTINGKSIQKNEECGVEATSDRVIGGTDTAIDESPFLALLYYELPKSGKLTYNCGGTLIKTRTVLTAAHCVEGNLGKTLQFVRLGEWNTKTEKDCVDDECADDPIDLKVIDKFIHPDRDAGRKTNDIAILILAEKFNYTDFVRPICLPSQNFLPPIDDEQILLVAGWGSTTQFISLKSAIKQKLTVEYVTHDECKEAYKNELISNEQHICAGGERKEGVCKGDSGGPLMAHDSGKLYIVGIVSFGTQTCAEAGIPGVFTNVWAYIDWINEKAI